MLAKARSLNGYGIMSRQQLETIFAIGSIPKPTPEPSPETSFWHSAMSTQMQTHSYSILAFWHIVAVVDTICFVCSH